MQIKKNQEILSELNKSLALVNGKTVISLWKILLLFIVLNLIAINLINYWQPLNHSNIKQSNDSKQGAIISAHELQSIFNKFKENPDYNSFNLIQKAVELDGKINNLKIHIPNKNYLMVDEINTNIEKIVSSVPSIKLFQTNLESLYSNIQSNKYKILSKNNTIKVDVAKKLLSSLDKIEKVINKLKNRPWLSTAVVSEYQEYIENIALDLEQYNQLVEDSTDSSIKDAVNNLSEVFNNFNNIMPEILKLSDVSLQLKQADINQSELLNALKLTNIEFIDDFSDRTIIILTIIFNTLLLMGLIMVVKVFEKINKIYKTRQHKNEIYFLSHINKENKLEQIEQHEIVLADKKDIDYSSKSLNYKSNEIVNNCENIQIKIDCIEKGLSRNNLCLESVKKDCGEINKYSQNIIDLFISFGNQNQMEVETDVKKESCV